jgi:hypothetical protein
MYNFLPWRLILATTLVLVGSYPIITYAQRNDGQAATFNIVSCALVGGVGAWINRNPDEKGGNAFLRGTVRGALGGALVYGSKQMIYSFGQTNRGGWAWASKLTNAAGLSIVEGAAANNPFLSSWHFNFGFNRLEFTRGKALTPKFKYKVMPFALGAFIYANFRGRLNLGETFRIGHPIFYSDDLSLPRYSFEPLGFAVANSIIVNSEFSNGLLLAHEIIHTYQYDERAYVNPFFKHLRNKWTNKSQFSKTYGKWVYTDINFLTDNLFYYLGSLRNRCFWDNPFEQEANFYSDRLNCEFYLL